MLTIKRLSFEEANILLAGAAAKATEMNVPMCTAVTDESGHLIKFDRMDGGKVSSISIAIDKAFTGATARKGTHVYNELCQPGKPTFGIHVTNGGLWYSPRRPNLRRSRNRLFLRKNRNEGLKLSPSLCLKRSTKCQNSNSRSPAGTTIAPAL